MQSDVLLDHHSHSHALVTMVICTRRSTAMAARATTRVPALALLSRQTLPLHFAAGSLRELRDLVPAIGTAEGTQ